MSLLSIFLIAGILIGGFLGWYIGFNSRVFDIWVNPRLRGDKGK